MQQSCRTGFASCNMFHLSDLAHAHDGAHDIVLFGKMA